MAIEVDQKLIFPDQFDLKENPDYDDALMIYDAKAGKVKQTKMEAIQAAAGNNVIGSMTPDGSPSGSEVAGQSYRVSNTTGDVLVFPNFLDSNGDPVQLEADERSGYLIKDGDSWAYVDNTAQTDTSSLVPKADIVDNVITEDADKVLSAKQGAELNKKTEDNQISVNILAQGFLPAVIAAGTAIADTNEPYSGGAGIKAPAGVASKNWIYAPINAWNQGLSELVGKTVKFAYIVEAIGYTGNFNGTIRVYTASGHTDTTFPSGNVVSLGNDRWLFRYDYTVDGTETKFELWASPKAQFTPAADILFQTVSATYQIATELETPNTATVNALIDSTVQNKIDANNLMLEITDQTWFGEGVAGGTRTYNPPKITIPVGQTGYGSYIRYDAIKEVPGLIKDFVGATLRFKFLIKAINYLGSGIHTRLQYKQGTGATTITALNEQITVLSTNGNEQLIYGSVDIVLDNDAVLVAPIMIYYSTSLSENESSFEILESYMTVVKAGTNVTLQNSQNLLQKQAIDAGVAKGINPIPVILRAKKDGIVGTDCEFAGNRAIQDAIESITDASALNPYIIMVYPGVYEALLQADFNSQGSVSGNYAFIRGKDNVSVIGIDPKRCIIKGFLPDNLGTGYSGYQTVYWDCNNATLAGLTITGQNLRYPVHIDGGRSGSKGYYNNIKNCIIRHFGNTGDAASWASWTPIGLGLSMGQELVIEDCVLRTAFYPGYVHNNNDYDSGAVLRFKNVRFVSESTKAFQVQSLGSKTGDILSLEGCSFNGYVFSANNSPYLSSTLANQSYNHMDFRIIGHGNSPLYWNPEFTGKGLRITSKSTGSGSTVRFDPNSTAFPVIIKDPTITETYEDDYGEINQDGYCYKDGADILSGYAMGRLDIGADGVGGSPGTNITGLGKRLGDCSTNNLTLGITVDGTDYSVVFNRDYTNDTTNAAIRNEILAVIGDVADIKEWIVGNDYYPEFTDSMESVTNNLPTAILKGMAVVISGMDVRLATAADTKITGIALDDVTPGKNGRILTRGYISTIETNRFSTLQETYATVNKGDALGISATDGKLSKAADPILTAIADGIVAVNC